MGTNVTRARSERGTLWIEAAFLMPVMITLALGTAELGSYYVQRSAIANIAQNIATAVQVKPDITAQEMYEYQKSLGGGTDTHQRAEGS